MSSRRRPILSPPGRGSTARPWRCSRPGASRNEPRIVWASWGSGSPRERPRVEHELVVAGRLDGDVEMLQDLQKRRDVPDLRDVLDEKRAPTEEGCRKHRQRLVLVARGDDRPRNAVPALDDEFPASGNARVGFHARPPSRRPARAHCTPARQSVGSGGGFHNAWLDRMRCAVLALPNRNRAIPGDDRQAATGVPAGCARSPIRERSSRVGHRRRALAEQRRSSEEKLLYRRHSSRDRAQLRASTSER